MTDESQGSSRATLAPFDLLRCAGVATQAVDALAQPRTQHALDALHATTLRLHAAQKAVTDALHALVSQLKTDATLRHHVLRLKRDVHNNRLPRLEQPVMEDIAQALDEAPRAQWQAWLEGVQLHQQQQQALTAAIELDLNDVAAALQRSLSNKNLRSGIASSSDSVHQALAAERPERWRQPGHRDTRTLVTYLSRAALKTSPFSTFTPQGLVRDQLLQPPPTLPLHASVTPLLPQTLLAACAQHEELAPAFRYQVVHTWHGTDGTLRGLLSSTTVRDGLHWRSERLCDLSAYAERLSTFTAGELLSYERTLSCLGGESPKATLSRCLASGLLRAVAPWDEQDTRPLQTLAHALAALPGAVAQDAAGGVHSVADAAAQLCAVELDTRRAARLALRTRSVQALQRLGATVPRWLQEGRIAYEDAAVTDEVLADEVRIPSGVRQDLEQYTQWVRPGIFRSALERVLREAFVKDYGSGGVCTSVMRFLDDFLSHPDAQRVLQSAATEDAERTVRDLGKAPAPRAAPSASSACPSMTVLYQLAAADPAALARGDYLLVVNQLSSGLGRLMTRLRHLFPGQDGLADALHAWISESYPEARIAELLPSRDTNGLEHASGGLFPRLLWPADAPHSTHSSQSADIDLASLQLRHDPVSDTLTLCRADGEPIACPNLGPIPDHLIFGPIRLLITLANPWVIGSPLSDRQPSVQGYGQAQEGVRHLPRVQRGRVVMRRARWLMPAKMFPLIQRHESNTDYLLRVDAWRRLHGLPSEVYVNMEGTLQFGVHKGRKPRWLCFSSLHLLAAVQPEIADQPEATLAFVEALPARNQHWARDAQAHSRATEFMSLVRWGRPHDAPTESPQREEACHGA